HLASALQRRATALVSQSPATYSRRAAQSHRTQVQISNWAALNVRADWNFLRHSPLKPCIDSLDAATDR
ncbi:MAG: hypothetical protein ACK6EB_26965, partial [Planctomyces sp.]